MEKFWDLLGRSVIFSGFIVAMLVSAYVYLVVTSKPVPDDLSKILFMIIAFFFGQRQGKQNNTAGQPPT